MVRVYGWFSLGSEFPYWVGEGRGGEEIGVTPWTASTKLHLYAEYLLNLSVRICRDLVFWAHPLLWLLDCKPDLAGAKTFVAFLCTEAPVRAVF